MNLSIVKSVYASTVELGEGITGAGFFQNIDEGNTSTVGGKFISSIITSLTVFGSLAFVLYFTMGAVKWVTAGGDKGKIGEAQSQMTQGAIGLIAIVASYFIIGIVGAVLGLDILNPFNILNSNSGINTPANSFGSQNNFNSNTR